MGIVTALGFEARALGGSPRFTIRRCGIAGPSVDESVRELRDVGCGLIVSWGTAGALSPQLKAGDLYLPEDVLSRQGSRLAADPEWRARFTAVVAGRRAVVSGTLLDSAAIVTEPLHKHQLLESTGAGAVDMESGPVAEVCVSLGLPFLAIRSIIDEADDRLPEPIARCITASGALRGPALAAALVLNPGHWSTLARLMRRYQRATSTLSLAARVLARCADAWPGP